MARRNHAPFVPDGSHGPGQPPRAERTGLPHGKGTMLYPDHRYTGSYSEGKAAGEGVVYLSGGEQLRGRFLKEKTSASEHMEFLNAAYDYEVQP